jgi:hypothetical protein
LLAVGLALVHVLRPSGAKPEPALASDEVAVAE